MHFLGDSLCHVAKDVNNPHFLSAVEFAVKHLVDAVVKNTFAYLSKEGLLSVENLPQFALDVPKQESHGDIACNIAMVVAKAAKKPPRDVAKLFVDHLQDAEKYVAKVEMAGPGFLNFFMNDAVYGQTVRNILQLGAQYGVKPANSTGKRVLIEFVSANPTGPLHLGHARGAFVGDAVARLLKAVGHDVQREFYINDSGNQVNVLGRSVYTRYCNLFLDADQQKQLSAGEYPGAYIIEIAKKLRDQVGDTLFAQDGSIPEEKWLPICRQFAIDENLRDIQEVLGLANISFDKYFPETDLHKSGAVMDIVTKYVDGGHTYIANQAAKYAEGGQEKVRDEESKAAQYADRQKGGTFLRTQQFGDEEDRVILRHDGSPVYLTADLAYHAHKAERGYHQSIDVWGADHAGHVPRIVAGMQALGYDKSKFEFILVQIVKLLRGGQEMRFSKRAGTVYELRDLLGTEEGVGPDAARFIFLMRAPQSQFEFDLDVVTKQSKDNPVFYVQYGHARTVQIEKRAEKVGQPFVGADNLDAATLARLSLSVEKNLIKKLALFPEIVQSAADALEPHRVIYYCQDLIAEYHGYYQFTKDKGRIVGDDAQLTQARLALTKAVGQTLKNAYETMLGLTAPDRMDNAGHDAENANEHDE